MTFSLHTWQIPGAKIIFFNYLHVTVLQLFSFHMNDSGKPLLCDHITVYT